MTVFFLILAFMIIVVSHIFRITSDDDCDKDINKWLKETLEEK